MSSQHRYKWKYNAKTESRKQFIMQVTQEQGSVRDTYNSKLFDSPWPWRDGNWQLLTTITASLSKTGTAVSLQAYWQSRILRRWEKRKVLCRRGGLEVCFCSLHIHFSWVFSYKTLEIVQICISSQFDLPVLICLLSVNYFSCSASFMSFCVPFLFFLFLQLAGQVDQCTARRTSKTTWEQYL